jgi:hypothetical protein
MSSWCQALGLQQSCILVALKLWERDKGSFLAACCAHLLLVPRGRGGLTMHCGGSLGLSVPQSVFELECFFLEFGLSSFWDGMSFPLASFLLI